MHKLSIIQCGKFNDSASPDIKNFDRVIDNKTIYKSMVTLTKMNNSRFEWDIVPRSFQRILHNLDKYGVYDLNVDTNKYIVKNNFYVFTNMHTANQDLEMIYDFLNKPYDLVAQPADTAVFNLTCEDNFWWDIEHDLFIFSGTKERLVMFIKLLKEEHNKKYLKMPRHTRERYYSISTGGAVSR